MIATNYESSRMHARNIRLATAGVLGVAAAWPLLPAHPALICPLRSLTGVPCPLCGMTRACVAAAHGHIGASLAFQPMGIVLIAAAIVLLVRPALLTRLRPPPVWGVFALLGAMWLWNVGFNPTFHQWLLR
ncbi:MAG TPA: DUF2752 domain-containing protein [Acidimicrobiia bacterium]|jgi:hypothetical protein|nr:DUF2752 domain-containing protein [Acidimicrobiia bacterium]